MSLAATSDPRCWGQDLRTTSPNPAVGSDVRWTEIDLIAEAGISQALKEVETVVHAAGNTIDDLEAADVERTERLRRWGADGEVSTFPLVSKVGIGTVRSSTDHSLVST